MSDSEEFESSESEEEESDNEEFAEEFQIGIYGKKSSIRIQSFHFLKTGLLFCYFTPQKIFAKE